MAPRTLIVGNFLSASRANRAVCEELALRLGASGWTVITTSAKPARFARLADMVATAWQRRSDYDVAQVDVFSGAAFVLAEAVAAVLGAARKPFVLTLHGGNLPRFARRWPRRVRRLLRAAAVVTTPSAYLREEMRRYHDDLLLLPNAIDLARYRYRYRESPRPHLVWLRAFHRIYNPELAPSTVAELVARSPSDVRLRMTGADSGDGTLESTRSVISALHLDSVVELRPGIPKAEVPGWLDAGDIFINTADVDNTPVSVIEAMAAGLCIVSTNVGGIPYLLSHERDALLVPPRDAHAMAAAVGRLLVEPGLAARLSQGARRAAEDFDWGVTLPRWRELLESVYARGAT